MLLFIYFLFLQKHVIAVVEGVTVVATVSSKILQDGDSYKALLEIAHQLHGWCLFFVLSAKIMSVSNELISRCIFALRCSGVAASLRSTRARPSSYIL